MNKNRRKEISGLIMDMGELSAALESMKERIEAIKSEEEEYRDAMPENLQGSDKYSAAEGAIDSMESAMGEIETAFNSVETAVGHMETASE